MGLVPWLHRTAYQFVHFDLLTCNSHLGILQYNSVFDVVISADESGMVEYWSGAAKSYGFPKCVQFEHKIDTDLYEFAKVSMK